MAKIHHLTSILIPVHFPPRIGPKVIRETLENTLLGQEAYCRPQNVLLVVDKETPAERVLEEAAPGSPLHGLPLLRLRRNRGKAGAIKLGLEALLDRSEAPFLITRDCDGDHFIEDLPALVRLAQDLEGDRPVSVFGARPSLMKPMGWLREEWEKLTNALLIDCAVYLAARQEMVVDRRFWNGYSLDLQAGYRLYDRRAARIAISALSDLPDDPKAFVFACEPLPFLELVLEGGRVGQIRCTTRVDQPFSNYADFSLAQHYGGLLKYVGQRYRIPNAVLRTLFDNHLVDSPLYLSEHRDEVLKCRQTLDGEAPLLSGPRFV